MKRSNDNKRKTDTSSLKEALDDLLDTYRLKSKFQETQLLKTWEKMIGKAISKRTTKLYIKDRKMFVEISSAPLKQELNMSKSRLLEELNKEFEKDVIDEIIFL